MNTCAGTTKSGKRCKRKVKGDFCRQHIPKFTQHSFMAKFNVHLNDEEPPEEEFNPKLHLPLLTKWLNTHCTESYLDVSDITFTHVKDTIYNVTYKLNTDDDPDFINQSIIDADDDGNYPIVSENGVNLGLVSGYIVRT